jgi:hypothetical protein
MPGIDTAAPEWTDTDSASSSASAATTSASHRPR